MADSPKEGEAAQALFCAIADYFGSTKTDKEFDLKKYPTYYTFKKVFAKDIEDCFSKIDTPSVSLKDIENFFDKDNAWYQSSINIAKKLMDDISEISTKFSRIATPKLQDIMYVRGAKKEKGRNANAMEHIAELFDIANKNQPFFGDINKWSPADIYLVSKKGEKVITDETVMATGKLKKGYDFVDLNEMISKLIDDGDLLPLSLKKADKEAHIVKVNFVRSEEEKLFADIKYYGVSDWSKKYTVAKPITRDIKIYFSKDKKEKIKIRHDAYNANYGVNKAVKCEIEVTGAGGRGGSVVGIPLISNIIGEIDSSFATELKSAFEDGIRKYSKELEKLNKKYDVKPGTKLKSPSKENYDEDRATLSALYVANAIMPVIYKWFKGNEGSKDTEKLNDKLLQKFFEYTSSRTKKSSRFVIAK